MEQSVNINGSLSDIFFFFWTKSKPEIIVIYIQKFHKRRAKYNGQAVTGDDACFQLLHSQATRKETRSNRQTKRPVSGQFTFLANIRALPSTRSTVMAPPGIHCDSLGCHQFVSLRLTISEPVALILHRVSFF